MANNKQIYLTQNHRTVERLRTSRQLALKQLNQDGQRAGIEFAMNTADYLDLERLDRWKNTGGDVALVASQTGLAGVAKIMTNDDGSEEHTVDSAREVSGADINQPAWVEGFVQGALEKYHELRKELGGQ